MVQGSMRIAALVAALAPVSPFAAAQQRSAADMAQLIDNTRSCYQELTRVQAPESFGGVGPVVNAIARAERGDLSALDALPDRGALSRIQSAIVPHDQYAGALRVTTEAHDIHALRVMYTVCHAANPRSMQQLHAATDQQVMTAAHHVVECYHPWPEDKSAPDQGQCIAVPAE